MHFVQPASKLPTQINGLPHSYISYFSSRSRLSLLSRQKRDDAAFKFYIFVASKPVTVLKKKLEILNKIAGGSLYTGELNRKVTVLLTVVT